MSRSVWMSFGVNIVGSFAVGAIWGAAAGILEAFLVNHRSQVGLQNPLALLELVLNYVVYVGIGTVVLRLLLEALARPRPHTSQSERSTGPSTTGDGKHSGAGHLTETIVAACLFIGAFANFLQKGAMGPLPLTSPVSLGITAVSIVIIVLLVWRLRRFSLRRMRILRAAVVVWVVFGFAWYPLFGPHTGRLRGAGAKGSAGSAKNVLLIIVDTLRADFLDCYGAKWGASPSADRLAAGGTLFENHIAQSTWTLPSTASAYTGLLPSSHGAVATGLPMTPKATTLAEVLQKAGYRTAAFTENFYIRPQNGFGRGIDFFWTYWLPWNFNYTLLYRTRARLKLPMIELTLKRAFITIPDISTPEEVNWDARVTTDVGLDWIKKGGDTPFFAFFHYMGPHSPYGPREYLFDDDPPSGRLTDYPRPMGGPYPFGERAGQTTDQAIADMKKLYLADILCVENHIGRILHWLEETGKLSETLIIFTADHGEEFLDHGAWNHGSTAFEEVLRVPFIVYCEDIVPAGVRVNAVTRQIDLMPTVLDLVGLDCPQEVQGRSLRPIF
ncbi:MAG: sulfatase [Candidatus Latescibacterota bacterium]|nr:MAG: sulfatase [Candidatus Latescibacterota bacterium]